VKESITDRVARKFGAAVGSAAVHAMVLGGKMSLR
jgi:protease-4